MTITLLSETIAKAILATVEKDRCCNLGNITETVFRELAVAEAKASRTSPQSGAPRADPLLSVAASDLYWAIMNYLPLSRMHPRVHDKFRALASAIGMPSP